MDSGFTWWLRVLLRLLQFACALVALITISSGFVATSYYGRTAMLGSSPTTYAQLTSFFAMLYALWFLLAVEFTAFYIHPLWWLEVLMDTILFVMLLVAAIVFLDSDFVQQCFLYGFMLRCGSLTAGVVFLWITMALFLLSALLNFFFPPTATEVDYEYGGDRSHDVYQHETTPTARGHSKSPGGESA